jgi:hypothetical protein
MFLKPLTLYTNFKNLDDNVFLPMGIYHQTTINFTLKKLNNMKKSNSILALVTVLFIFSLTSCEVEPMPTEDDCNGKGSINITNSSVHTVQKIRINNINYGTLDPGESKEIWLNPGYYTITLPGISGGDGCQSPSGVTISECSSQGLSCSY